MRTEFFPIISRLFSGLESFPGWGRLVRILDGLYIYYHRKRNGSKQPVDILVEKLAVNSGVVIVVCKGNICRSPFLAEYLNKKASYKGVSFISAGLKSQESNVPPHNAIESASRFGIDLSSHRARLLKDEDVKSADLIVGMEPIHHLEFCLRYIRWRRKFLLLRALEDAPESLKLSDPFGRDRGGFQECYGLLAQDGETLLSAIQKLSERASS